MQHVILAESCFQCPDLVLVYVRTYLTYAMSEVLCTFRAQQYLDCTPYVVAAHLTWRSSVSPARGFFLLVSRNRVRTQA